MFVSFLEIACQNNEFTTNANANDLQLDIGPAACGESRSRLQPIGGVPANAAGLAALNPSPRAPTQQEASARQIVATAVGAALGAAPMFLSIQRDFDLICLRRQALIAWIAEGKSSTHIC